MINCLFMNLNLKTFFVEICVNLYNFESFFVPKRIYETQNEPGMPPHLLRLTEGCPVMLVRNLNPAAGMSNGTRMIVQKMHKFLLECKIINGDKAGEIVFV